MSDDLKRIYEEAGRQAYYFDQHVPRDLFRGQSKSEAKKGLPVIYPNPGFARKGGPPRLPDVEIVERDGKQIVKGCRSISGDYRGVSTFDRKNPALRGFSWYKLPEGTDIPEALAITQDSDFRNRANHFTIAPKDDMPLPLFQVWLNALAEHLVED
ncbi:MAG TPA: hypothetical protein VFO41_04810 [Alphaproteobacteria bacterium]|nr:hypothetical protein [Alphaproteobacteria bacterium]